MDHDDPRIEMLCREAIRTNDGECVELCCRAAHDDPDALARVAEILEGQEDA